VSIKHVLVTGATSGIGNAVALELLKRGHWVLATGRSQPNLQELENLAQTHPGSCQTYCGDLVKPETHQALANLLPDSAELVLVNSAGIAKFRATEEETWESIQESIEINLTATLALTSAVLPKMLKAGKGQIINFSSVAANRPLPGTTVYAATKAAVRMASLALAEEVRRKGIRVTVVSPGATDTNIWPNEEWVSPRDQMIPADELGKIICDIIDSPETLNVDEISVMPPKGIL
jgi:short-subunit dehydrogenase